jgi:hypothetical protein
VLLYAIYAGKRWAAAQISEKGWKASCFDRSKMCTTGLRILFSYKNFLKYPFFPKKKKKS